MKSKHHEEEKEIILKKILSEGSIDKTVSDILINLIGKTSVGLRSFTEVSNRYGGYDIGPDILAVYKDGIALRGEKLLDDFSGTMVHYMLHRNNEQIVYFLDRF